MDLYDARDFGRVHLRRCESANINHALEAIKRKPRTDVEIF